MHPVLKDWLQNLGCFLPLSFFGFCIAITNHWVSTVAGPARFVIIWQARILEGQHFPRLTTAICLLPALLGTWLLFVGLRRLLDRFGVYERPTTNVGFERPKQGT